LKILILHDYVPDGAPPDLMDNLHQVDLVAGLLTAMGHEIVRQPVSGSLEKTMAGVLDQGPDLVFNLVESIKGSGRRIHLAPAALERFGMAYAGCPSRAVKLTNDKLTAKEVMRQSGLPTPHWITLHDHGEELPSSSRYIIKSVWEHASLGLDEDSVQSTADPARLRREMERRAGALGGACFAEEFIEGREFNLSLLAGENGPEVLPPAEIVFQGYGPEMLRIVGYRAKWIADSYEYNNTPRAFGEGEGESQLAAVLSELALSCWSVFGLRGWARVDFRVDEQNRPYILEVNTNPCLADDAGFMAAARERGLDDTQVMARILADANRPGEAVRQGI
jgi:D-alanine-D-alanine ligase